MSSDQPYTLTTALVRGRYSDGATYQGVEVAYMDEHLDAFDAWLAGVKRDAAREALDGLARWADLRVREAITDKGADDWRRTRFAVVAPRDAHYPIPEETP